MVGVHAAFASDGAAQGLLEWGRPVPSGASDVPAHGYSGFETALLQVTGWHLVSGFVGEYKVK